VFQLRLQQNAPQKQIKECERSVNMISIACHVIKTKIEQIREDKNNAGEKEN
jgi:hypothetical protein